MRMCPPLVTVFPSPGRRESRGVAQAVERGRAAGIAGCASDQSHHSSHSLGGALHVSPRVGKARRVRASGRYRGVDSPSGPGHLIRSARSRARVAFPPTNFRSCLALPLVRSTRGGPQRLANAPRRARRKASESTPLYRPLAFPRKPIPGCQKSRNVPNFSAADKYRDCPHRFL